MSALGFDYGVSRIYPLATIFFGYGGIARHLCNRSRQGWNGVYAMGTFHRGSSFKGYIVGKKRNFP